MNGKIYLIPAVLHEEGLAVLPAYITDAVKDCKAFFVENERSARRFFKRLWKEMVIDDYEWVTIHKAEAAVTDRFMALLRQGKNIGIVSEAGCPGIADPGQALVAAAQQAGITVMPLVGPSSILLALMASGLNGQHFCFNGYLPVDAAARAPAVRELENRSRKLGAQIFIETPYRNNQLLETLLKICQPHTRICIAANLTGPGEYVCTKTVAEWKKQPPDLHKQPAIFLLQA